jgi:predicted enzyme related to lactoylglutathione lyase
VIGRLDEVVVDCADPARLATFWQAVVGGEIVRQSGEWVAVVGPAQITIGFQRVPEAKAVKNRVHLDIAVDDLELAAAAAEALGAQRVGAPVPDPVGGFQVMLDPEGNEFCFIVGPTLVEDDSTAE